MEWVYSLIGAAIGSIIIGFVVTIAVLSSYEWETKHGKTKEEAEKATIWHIAIAAFVVIQVVMYLMEKRG